MAMSEFEPITLHIPIAPTAQMRPQIIKRGQHFGMGKRRRQVAAEKELIAHLRLGLPNQDQPHTGPLGISIKAFFKAPASRPPAKRGGLSAADWRTAAKYNLLRKFNKPDADNLAKQVKDCLTTIGFWSDDDQVTYLEVAKFEGWGQPHWEIEIWPLRVRATIGSRFSGLMKGALSLVKRDALATTTKEEK